MLAAAMTVSPGPCKKDVVSTLHVGQMIIAIGEPWNVRCRCPIHAGDNELPCTAGHFISHIAHTRHQPGRAACDCSLRQVSQLGRRHRNSRACEPQLRGTGTNAVRWLSPKLSNHGLRLGSALLVSAKGHWPLTLYRLSPGHCLERAAAGMCGGTGSIPHHQPPVCPGHEIRCSNCRNRHNTNLPLSVVAP